MLECLAADFPIFYQHLNAGHGDPVDAIYPPVLDQDIRMVEQQLGILLARSYKRFLRCTAGFCLLGGAINISFPHHRSLATS